MRVYHVVLIIIFLILTIFAVQKYWCIQGFHNNIQIPIQSGCVLDYLYEEESKLNVKLLSKEQIENLSKEKIDYWKNTEIIKELTKIYLKKKIWSNNEKLFSYYLDDYLNSNEKTSNENIVNNKEKIKKEIDELKEEIKKLENSLNQ